MDDLIDKYVEVCMEQAWSPEFGGDFSMEFKDIQGFSMQEYLDEFTEFLMSLSEKLTEGEDTDLLNIRDEILAEVNKMKYLLTLKLKYKLFLYIYCNKKINDYRKNNRVPVESGIRDIDALANRYNKAGDLLSPETSENLMVLRSALAMKKYLEDNGIEVIDAHIIQCGDMEFAVKKNDALRDTMPVLSGFCSWKTYVQNTYRYRS
jgi:hypothetical protein